MSDLQLEKEQIKDIMEKIVKETIENSQMFEEKATDPYSLFDNTGCY